MSENLSSKEAVLAADNVSKQVSSPEGTLTILSEVSFAIDRGDSVAVVGASGAGKSTLLALLAGLDLPTSGEIWLDSNNLTNLDEDGRAAVRAASVGFVFQSFHLVPSVSHIAINQFPDNRLRALAVPMRIPLQARDLMAFRINDDRDGQAKDAHGAGERFKHYAQFRISDVAQRFAELHRHRLQRRQDSSTDRCPGLHQTQGHTTHQIK